MPIVQHYSIPPGRHRRGRWINRNHVNGGVPQIPVCYRDIFYLFTLSLVIASGSAAIQYFYNNFPLTLTTNHYCSAMCLGIVSEIRVKERFPKVLIAIARVQKNNYNAYVF
jgi:hypothetical protein